MILHPITESYMEKIIVKPSKEKEEHMDIIIDGSVRLPSGMDEEKFNYKFMEFLEENGFEFLGITKMNTEE